MSIQTSIAKLENNIIITERLLHEVFSRLDPILLGVKVGEDSASAVGEKTSSVSERLIHINYSINSINNLMQSLIDRIDLDVPDETASSSK